MISRFTTIRSAPGSAAVALSLLLALGACSSSDDDDDLLDTTPDGDALTVTLSPDQEVPPVTTAGDASGTATITVDESSGDVSGSVTVTDLTGPAQAAHIHRGASGTNGPVIITLEPADGSDPAADGANVTEWVVPNGSTLDADQLEAYADGELYFNVHTEANPGGEVRGQIVPPGTEPDDDALTVTLSPDQEVPPVTGQDGASGEASLGVDDDGAVSGTLTVEGLSGPARAAHIHRGFQGGNGPVLIGLEPADGSDPAADGANVTEWVVPDDATLDETGREALDRGELYFNVHTEANPGGEVRGQIVPDGDGAPTFFTVRIENVSTPGTLATSTGSVAVPLSPGAYVVHRGEASPLFESGAAASEALEMVAEDGDPSGYTGDDGVPGAAVFNTPVGADEPGAIGPGEDFGGTAYEFVVSGVPGDKLSLVTMFIQSNDYFYTFTDEDDSLSLFDEDGEPVSGDQSDSLALWDAGTEQDEALGEGPNQAPRQAAADTGADEGGNVASLASQEETVELNGDVVVLTVTPIAEESETD